MLELMLRMVLVGALTSLAALLFERALAHLRFPSRYPWTIALLLTTILPLLPEVKRSPVVGVVPEFSAPAFVISAAADAGSLIPVNFPVLVWVVSVALILVVYCSAFVQLARVKRSWRQSRLGDANVFVSERYGPAVFGFLNPRIVIPAWVCTAAPTEQELWLSNISGAMKDPIERRVTGRRRR